MPVVMMSGHATIDTAVEATKIGAVGFLEKPIGMQKLLAAVRQGLERAPKGGGALSLAAFPRSSVLKDLRRRHSAVAGIVEKAVPMAGTFQTRALEQSIVGSATEVEAAAFYARTLRLKHE